VRADPPAGGIPVRHGENPPKDIAPVNGNPVTG